MMKECQYHRVKRDRLIQRDSFMLRVIGFVVAGFILTLPASAATICGYNDTSGKLSGVTATCKANGDTTEANLSGGTNYFTLSGINFNCPNSYCWAQKGNELCAAVAKIDGQTGNYVCSNNSNCSTPLSNGQIGGVICGEGQICCIAKASSAVSTSGGGSGSSPSSLEVPDPLNGVTIPGLIGNVIRTFAGIAGSIALVVFVLGGFQYILSGGDGAKVKSATAMLRNGAIGIILIFGAYFLTSTIINLILVRN